MTVLLVGYGSTDPAANAEVHRAARLLWEGRGYAGVETAFVSMAAPDVPSGLDRCVRLGGRPVCRRCLVLYPVAFAVAGLSLAGIGWPDALDPWLLALLPLPAVVEFCLEQARRITYSPARQIAVTLPAAIALGRGFARYVEDPADLLFWAMALGYGGICAAFLAWRWLDEHAL